MPKYDYLCPDCGDWSAQFNVIARRDEAPPCSSCGGTTARGWKPGPVTEEKVQPETALTGTAWHEYECSGCKLTDLLVVDFDKGERCGHPRGCEKCGGAMFWRPGWNIDRFSETFPYYDRAAGRIFQNKQERRDWMKANRFEEVGPDFKVSPHTHKARKRVEEEDVEVEGWINELNNDPEVLRAQDKGQLDYDSIPMR